MALNDWFTQAYGLALDQLAQSLRQGELPVFVRVADTLVLLHDGGRWSASVRPGSYHAAKVRSHVPVALYLRLRASLDRPLDEQELTRLAELRDQLQRWPAEQGDGASDGAFIQRWLTEVIERRRVGGRELADLQRHAQGRLDHDLKEAALAEMRCLHQTVGNWTRTWSKATWRQVRVAIGAGHQPRYRQAAKQYFERILGVSSGVSEGAANEGPVVYAENANSVDEALRHLATHLLDRELAGFFLNDPEGLQQDLLADAADAALDTLEVRAAV